MCCHAYAYGSFSIHCIVKKLNFTRSIKLGSSISEQQRHYITEIATFTSSTIHWTRSAFTGPALACTGRGIPASQRTWPTIKMRWTSWTKWTNNHMRWTSWTRTARVNVVDERVATWSWFVVFMRTVHFKIHCIVRKIYFTEHFCIYFLLILFSSTMQWTRTACTWLALACSGRVRHASPCTGPAGQGARGGPAGRGGLGMREWLLGASEWLPWS